MFSFVETGFSVSIDLSKGMYFGEGYSSSEDKRQRYELVAMANTSSKVQMSKLLSNRIVTTTDKRHEIKPYRLL